MKRTLAVMFVGYALCWHGLAQEAPHEIRIVNGREVDITPVIEWMQKSGTNSRPMLHWKSMNVQSIRKQVGSWDVCTVENEQGQPVEIILANLPAKVREPLITSTQIRARILALQNAARGLAANPSNGPQARAFVSAQSDGIARELDALIAKKDAISAAVRIALTTKVYAMKSGAKYAGLDVWDCGKVKSATSSRL